MATLGDRLKRAREDAGLSQSELARRIGVKPQSIQAIEAGTVQGTKHIVRLAETLGVRPRWLQDGHGQTKAEKLNSTVTRPPTTFAVAELDVRAQGGAGALLDDHSEHQVVDEWRLPRELIRGQTTAPAEGLRIARIYGDSMEPRFRAGDRVLIDTTDRVPSPAGVFFVWDGLGLVCKHVEVVMYSDPPEVRLTPENPHYETFTFPLADVQIQGRVIGRWEWT